jgi:O-antigen/teichoic acid export membrane protein
MRRLVSRDLVNRLARFGAAVFLARALTLEEYGIVNTGIALAGIAITATSLGLNDLGAREVAAAPSDVFGRSRLAGQILAARMTLLGALAAIATATVVLVSPAEIGLCLLIVALALTTASSAEWLLRGLERMAELGNTIALGGLIVLGGAAILLATGGSAVSGLTVILIGELVATSASWAWAGTVPGLRLESSSIRNLLVRSWPLALSSLALYSYYANLDTILLAALRSADEAGLYSAPYRVFLGLNAISIYTSIAFLPLLTRAVEMGDHGPAFESLRRGVRYLLAYSVLLLAAAEIGGADMLGTLFGSEFVAMGDVFVVLCLAITWFSVGFPLGYGLIAQNENRRYLAGAATGGILNLVLNLILIPPYGPIGAAAATAGAVVAACLVWLWGNRILGRETLADLVAMSAVSIAAVLAITVDDLRLPAILFTLLIGALCVIPLYAERNASGGS